MLAFDAASLVTAPALCKQNTGQPGLQQARFVACWGGNSCFL